jgi:RNA polymerase sigma-B factor
MFETGAEAHTSPEDRTPVSTEGEQHRMQSNPHRTDIELIAAHRRTSDAASREQLVMRHAGLVRSIARRYHGRGLAPDDIEQTGYLGLIQAVDRYDPSRGVPLRAYAARTIEGEIMHLFRDRGWAVRVPRSLQEMSRRVAAVRERIGHQLGRSPSLEELAEAVGESEERVAEAIAAGRAYAAEPLVEPDAAPESGSAEGVPAGRVLASEEPGFTAVEDRDLLERAMRALPERERRIVGLRVYHDLTQAEIAARTGISQMHVSRLLRASLDAIEQEIDQAAVA